MADNVDRDALWRKAVDKWVCCGLFARRLGGFTLEEEEAIRQRLHAGDYYWSGKARRDWVFHIANQHPLVGIVLCHPLHPYSKRERLCLEWLHWCATVSCLVLVRQSLRAEHAIREEEDDKIGDAITVYTHVTLPLLVIQSMLKSVARQSGRPNGFLERCVGKRALCVIQWLMICMWAVAVMGFMTLCLLIAQWPGSWNDYGRDVPKMESWARGTLFSLGMAYLTWFAQDLFRPMVPPFTWPPAIGFFGKWRREARTRHSSSRFVESWMAHPWIARFRRDTNNSGITMTTPMAAAGA